MSYALQKVCCTFESQYSTMKKIFILYFSILSFSLVNAQSVTNTAPAASAPADVLSVKETIYDFGKIPQGKPVYHFFDIINTGNKPLKLDNVQASCGCTTPEWSHDEIAPGAISQIKVGYNSASEGPFDKFITVTYNGTTTKQIRIKGEVWKAPSGAAPANTSVNFLKQQIQK
jgi:hypothetical protein